MNGHRARSIIAALVLAVAALHAAPAAAAPGAILTVVDPPGNCDGFGVALWPPDRIVYTCPGVPALLLTDLGSNALGQIGLYDVITHNRVFVDAVAWDSHHDVFWGGETEAGQCRVWRIEPLTGAASLRFSYVDPHGGCNLAFFDGITFNPQSVTLFLSPMRHPVIHHVDQAGGSVGPDIDFSPQATPHCGRPCENSGLALGRNDVLFAGATGTGQIFMFDAATRSLLGLLATVGGEVEDLECGPVVGAGTETLLARDQFSDRITVVEVPRGSCSERDLPPETTLVDYPSRYTQALSAEFRFTGVDDRTPAAALTYECRLDGSPHPCTSPARYGPLAEGLHHFTVAAIDGAHQIDPTPSEYEWTVDQTTPLVSLAVNCALLGSAGWCRSPSLSLFGSAIDSLSPLTDVSCWVNGRSIHVANPCSATVRGEGTHTLEVRGSDAAGNTIAPVETHSIDSVEPTGSVFVPQIVSVGAFAVGWQVLDQTSGLARITVEEAALGASGFRAVCTQALGGNLQSGSCARNPSPGYYCYRIEVSDVAGNSFTSASVTPSSPNSLSSGVCTIKIP